MLALTEWEEELRDRILKQVKGVGFKVNPHLRLDDHTKQSYRNVQIRAKHSQINEHHSTLSRFVDTAKKFCLDGRDIDPGKIDLELR